MKKLICLLIALPFYFLTSCEMQYKDEIFFDKYQLIYGIWEFQYGVGETGFINKPEHFIEFIPNGQFRYNEGKCGRVKIILQNQTDLCINFNSLFPKVKEGFVSFNGSDTMAINYNGYLHFYFRR
jgi:hypothetical protein